MSIFNKWNNCKRSDAGTDIIWSHLFYHVIRILIDVYEQQLLVTTYSNPDPHDFTCLYYDNCNVELEYVNIYQKVSSIRMPV